MEVDAKLQKTIRDAIDFVRQFGERYLWLEALCIVQDDAENIKDLTGKMDLIYRGAIFTITAAAGAGAESSLPGVQPGSRNLQQYIEEINSSVRLLLLPSLDIKLQRRLTNLGLDLSGANPFSLEIYLRRRYRLLPVRAAYVPRRLLRRETRC